MFLKKIEISTIGRVWRRVSIDSDEPTHAGAYSSLQRRAFVVRRRRRAVVGDDALGEVGVRHARRRIAPVGKLEAQHVATRHVDPTAVGRRERGVAWEHVSPKVLIKLPNGEEHPLPIR